MMAFIGACALLIMGESGLALAAGGQEAGVGSMIVNNITSALFGALVGAFFSERLRKFRMILCGIIFAIIAVMIYIGIPPVGVVISFVIGMVVAYKALKLKTAQNNLNGIRDTTFGSAQWATKAYIEEHKLSGSTGIRLGEYTLGKGDALPLHYEGNRHLLTVAPTRSGKGVSSIIPNLLTYEGSALVIDPKGENAMITAKRRGKGDPTHNIEGLGQDIFVLDPWGITGIKSACFNPLDWLVASDPDINENARMLADAIVTGRGGNSDPFWDEESKALLVGIMLHVALDDSEAKNRHLGRVRDILVMGANDFKNIMEIMARNSNGLVASTAQRTASKEPKLRNNVLASLQSHTHFLDSPRIRANLTKSDFKFEDLKTKKQTIYLVLPADRLSAFGAWLRLMVQQAITMNARNIHIKPEKPILFMLDEMPALGKLAAIEQAYGLMAGFGIQLWGIVQDFGQLERVYDKSWETFLGNAGVIQYFGSRDLKTAEYFSKLCGVHTVEKFSFSNTIANTFGRFTSYGNSSNEQGTSSSSGFGSNESESISNGTTRDVVQRQLAYTDELMTLKDDSELVFVENFNPIKGKKVRWYNDKLLKELGTSLEEATPAAANQDDKTPPTPSNSNQEDDVLEAVG